jgi:hypothetical protein
MKREGKDIIKKIVRCSKRIKTVPMKDTPESDANKG